MKKSLALAKYVIPRRGCVEGPQVEAYERAFAARVGAGHAIAFMKGRFALYAALKALGLGSGDEIVMPGYTCAVVPGAASNLGMTPTYADIEPTYCTPPLATLREKVAPQTKAIMIQHTYGWPNVDLGEIATFARERGLILLEDCCHALGTRAHGKHVGNWGTAGFFSTQWSKPFTTGLGGVLVCNDDDVAAKVRRVREESAHAPSAKLAAQLAVQNIIFDVAVYPSTVTAARQLYRKLSRSSMVTGSTNKKEYDAWDEKQFLRMSEVQATAGLCDLRRYDRYARRRLELMAYYREELPKIGYDISPMPDESEVALLRFPVRVHDKRAALERAAKLHLELGDWFVQPMHSQMLPYECLGYRRGLCPEAERAAEEIVNLPTHERVSDRHAGKLIEFLRTECEPASPPSG